MNSILVKQLTAGKSISATPRLRTARRYDDFLAQLLRGPIPIDPSGAFYEDGYVRCTGRYFEVTRTVLRLEFGGYRQAGNNHSRHDVPIVREVLSCGHSTEDTAGCYNWRRPRKTAVCCQCSDAIPPIPDEECLYERSARSYR